MMDTLWFVIVLVLLAVVSVALVLVLVVLGFAVIVDVILRRKLRRINMAEALKSVE